MNMYKKETTAIKQPFPKLKTNKKRMKTNLLIHIVICKFLQSCRKGLLCFVSTPLFQI